MTTPVRTYRQPVSRYWWARRPSYRWFMLRELSCVAVAWTVVYLVLLVRAVAAGPLPYARFLDWSAHPVIVAVNTLTLILLVVHAITWSNLAPRAMELRVRGRRVPARAMLAGQYAAWVVVSAVIAWVVLS
jgi:fumarate reductase subunit C